MWVRVMASGKGNRACQMEFLKPYLNRIPFRELLQRPAQKN
ncbi:hypothetical protein M5D96_006219 [Drosophila gunungcola]|uniref:Uncharacterized protein n=1 Tax=Drosophila gunungcola TaxID=103775 RepID=A0A9Q0BQP8_9MUSC|nr:hypothetical protein M5D96_006219 [Drosophila gunungcola]